MLNDERIIVFGLGQRFKEIKGKYSDLFEKLNVVAYLDNNEKLWGNQWGNVPVMSPLSIAGLSYDKIVLTTVYVKDMKEQMIGLGVPKEKIILWDEFFSRAQQGTFLTYGAKSQSGSSGKSRLLLISVELNYNGGTMAILNAARALKLHGYDVTVSASGGDRRLIKELSEENFQTVIVPAINYPGEEELKWICQFDVVIVNVFQMIRCACEISHRKPVIWWIHECSNRFDKIYLWIRDNYSEYDHMEAMRNIKVVAVSAIAEKNFNNYYKDRIKEVIPYGIPDRYSNRSNVLPRSPKYIFAVIGSILPRKGQLIFLDAVRMLDEEQKKHMEFWIIGYLGEDSYSEEVRKNAESMPEVKLLGELDQEHMQKKYEKISVVVCSSLEETMSMTITEGMMNEKICITTDATGMADYITDGGNGLICRAGDANSLCQKMKWVADHPEQCEEIRKNARRTYENYFTLQKFAQRMHSVIELTVKGR